VAGFVPTAAARSTMAGVEIVAASVDERHSAGWPALLQLPRTRRLNHHVSRARSRKRAVVGAACWGSGSGRASKQPCAARVGGYLAPGAATSSVRIALLHHA
jgi:hypothetical protein